MLYHPQIKFMNIQNVNVAIEWECTKLHTYNTS